MTDWKLPREGSCRCGKVRFVIGAAPLLTMACHCTGCQKMSSSAFSLSAAIPADAFAVTAGEPVIGGLHGATRHYFCPHCMSWLFTRPEGMDWFVNVRSAMFGNGPEWAPFVETYMAEKMPFAATGAPHSYAALPAMEEYAQLTEDFARAHAGSEAASGTPA